MTTLADRIRSLVEASGKSNREIADCLGVTDATIQQWQDGQTSPTVDNMLRFARLFEVDPEYLLLGKGEAPSHITIDDSTVEIPLLPPEYAKGIDLIKTYGSHWTALQHVRVAKSLLYKYCQRSDPKMLFLVTCYGDSMEPHIKEGDSVIADVAQQHVHGDGLYVIRMGTGIYVKRIQVLPGYKFMIIPDNPLYRSFQIAPDEFSVIGKVVICLRLNGY